MSGLSPLIKRGLITSTVSAAKTTAKAAKIPIWFSASDLTMERQRKADAVVTALIRMGRVMRPRESRTVLPALICVKKCRE